MTLTNDQRSARFENAIAAYSDDETLVSLVDFLADAMHWCKINGHTLRDLLDTAEMHFEAEVNGDDIPDDLNQQANERNQP